MSNPAARRLVMLLGLGVLTLWLLGLVMLRPQRTPQWATPGPRAADYRVNVNTAPAGELQLLDGVGAVLAENIVTHRREHGPFDEPTDLDAVPMIGPITLERIEPWVRFKSPQPRLGPSLDAPASPEAGAIAP